MADMRQRWPELRMLHGEGHDHVRAEGSASQGTARLPCRARVAALRTAPHGVQPSGRAEAGGVTDARPSRHAWTHGV